MATNVNQQQGYPQSATIADAEGRITQPWRQFFVSLWNRTGAQLGGTVQAEAGQVGGSLVSFFPTNTNVIESGNLTGDVTTNNTLATTLATVNSSVGSFTLANITVDAKGRVTAAANGQTTGLSVTITTAKLTNTGTQGSMTFVNGLLTGQVQAT